MIMNGNSREKAREPREMSGHIPEALIESVPEASGISNNAGASFRDTERFLGYRSDQL